MVEVFEAKFDDPNRQLKRFLKYTSGEVTELVTNWIHLFPGVCYEQVDTASREIWRPIQHFGYFSKRN